MLGYFVPHEGSNYEAWGLISFSSLAIYKAYRKRLRKDEEARANAARLVHRHAGERALEVTLLGRKHLVDLLPSVNAL